MKSLISFLKPMFKIGCIGFGGGSALIPVIEEELFGAGKLDSKQNLDRDVIVANITPGALPVEIAGEIGRRNFGRWGMVLGASFMALPGALGTFLVLTVLAGARQEVLNAVNIASVGISAFVIYMLIHYIEDAVKRDREPQRRVGSVFVIFLVASLVCGKNIRRLFGVGDDALLGLSTIHVLISAYAIALLFSFFTRHRYPKNSSKESFQAIDIKALCKDLAGWFLFLIVCIMPVLLYSSNLCQFFSFIGKSILSVFMSFGGGDAYITIADGIFVENGIISSDEFFGEIVSVVNILPGSILCKTLVGIGYCCGSVMEDSMWGGGLWAIAGFAVSISMSCISFTVASYCYDVFSTSRTFCILKQWIRPIISGLLINVILSLLNHNKNIFVRDCGLSARALVCTFVLVFMNGYLGKKKCFKAFTLVIINVFVAYFVMLV